MGTGDALMGFWLHFLLIVLRCSGMFILTPYWGRANIPAMVRVILAVLMAGILAGIYPPAGAVYETVLAYVLVCFSEMAVGLAVGFMTTMFFSAVYTAGQMIDMQIGFGMVNVVDPTMNVQVPITGSLINLVVMLTFTVTNGPLHLVNLMGRSFAVMAPGQIALDWELLGLLMAEAFTRSFLFGLQMALPIVASGFLGEVALGLLVRTAPQMNMFVIGITLKVILGTFMMGLLISAYAFVTAPLFDYMYGFIERVFALG
jgi:flagellar biosynthetic protein FliR